MKSPDTERILDAIAYWMSLFAILIAGYFALSDYATGLYGIAMQLLFGFTAMLLMLTRLVSAVRDK